MSGVEPSEIQRLGKALDEARQAHQLDEARLLGVAQGIAERAICGSLPDAVMVREYRAVRS